MKVYIAAPYTCRAAAIAVMHVLEAAGHVVTSRWLRETNPNCDANAKKDLTDIDNADALLALNFKEWQDKGSGGRHVELGYALALGKRIVLYGPRTNIFHHLDSVTAVDSIGGVLSALASDLFEGLQEKEAIK